MIPDVKMKAGTEFVTYINKYKLQGDGSTIDYDIDLSKIKNFTRFEKKKDTLSFKPKVADQGLYIVSVIVTKKFQVLPPQMG